MCTLCYKYVSFFFPPRNSDPSVNYVTQRYENIIRPPNDKRLYRGLILNNEMKVLLISDPTTNKCAASMTTGVGELLSRYFLIVMRFWKTRLRLKSITKYHLLHFTQTKKKTKKTFNVVSENMLGLHVFSPESMFSNNGSGDSINCMDYYFPQELYMTSEMYQA